MSSKDDIINNLKESAKAMNEVPTPPIMPEDVVYIKMPDGRLALCSKRFIKDWEDAKDEAVNI